MEHLHFEQTGAMQGQPFEPDTQDGDVQQWLTVSPEAFEYTYFGVSGDYA